MPFFEYYFFIWLWNITFNCRGFQDNFKRKKIFSYFHKRKDDIIFLQETHSSSTDEKWWSSQWDGHSWFSSFASNSRGVGILVKSSVVVITTKEVIFDPEGRYIILDASFDGFHLILVNVYAPNNDDPIFFSLIILLSWITCKIWIPPVWLFQGTVIFVLIHLIIKGLNHITLMSILRMFLMLLWMNST